MTKKDSKKRGFTLLEIIIVLVVMGILIAAAAIGYQNVTIRSRDARRRADIGKVQGALEQYRSNETSLNGNYPDETYTYDGLTVLLVPNYLPEMPQDPVAGRHYIYEPYCYFIDRSSGLPLKVCPAYILTATLENGTDYHINQNGELTKYQPTPVITPTPTPYSGTLPTPTPTPTSIPGGLPSSTPVPSCPNDPVNCVDLGPGSCKPTNCGGLGQQCQFDSACGYTVCCTNN